MAVGTALYGSGKKGWENNQRYTIPNECKGEARPLCLCSSALTACICTITRQGVLYNVYGGRQVRVVGVRRREREDMESQSF